MLYRLSRATPANWCANVIVILSLAVGVVATDVDAGEELSFLTWADYIDPDVVTEFEQETGIKIKFAYYESDDARDEILTRSDGRDYDLAIVNGLMLQSYSQRNWLAPVTMMELPNLTLVERRWRTARLWLQKELADA